MFKNLTVEKLGIYLAFIILFFAFVLLEFNFKDDFIMSYNINQTHKTLDKYSKKKFDFNELESKTLYKFLGIADSLQHNLEQDWITYVTISVIKDKHNQNIQHKYVKTQQEINFIKLLITTEINRRQYEYVRSNVNNKFKF